MSSGSILTIIGVLVALAPFSGLPLSWLEFILPILGVVIAFLGYSLRGKTEKETVPEVAPAYQPSSY